MTEKSLERVESTAGRSRAALAAALLLALGVSFAAPGCAPSTAEAIAGRTLVVLVRAPLDSLPGPGSAAAFRDPYPSGSQVVLWDADRPGVSPITLSGGFDAAGAPCVSPDGTRLLFCARGKPGGTWRIYESSVLGGTPVPVSPEGANATSAAYAAGGRVVFSCDLGRTRDPRDGGPAFSIYSSDRDGSNLTRLTYSPASEVDPFVLDDGRILYSAWQPSGMGRPEGAWALFTIRNDGTAVFSFYGSHRGPYWKRRPRQVGREVIFIAADGEGSRIQGVSLRRPLKSTRQVGGSATGSWRSGDAWRDGALLASHRPAAASGKGSFGLYLVSLDEEGLPEPLLDDPTVDEVDAVLVGALPRPRGIVSMVKEDAKTGEILCLDARLSDRESPWKLDVRSAARIQVYEGRPAPLGEGGPAVHGSPLQGFPYPVESKLLGTHELHRDGSVRFEVPANTPLRFRTVDDKGRIILDSQGWVWLRPAEKRGCIGCHEDRELAPTNHLPEAVLLRPAPVEAEEDLTGVLK